ncbi:MAG: hypothetical protein U0174_19895 [Polyangiaceae bacterium]
MRAFFVSCVSVGVLGLGVACGGEDATGNQPDSSSTYSPDPYDGDPKSDGGITVKDSGTSSSSGGNDASPDTSTCNDPDDLGGPESPKQLPAITDDDVNPPHKIKGILSSNKDVDAYKYLANDTTGHVTNLNAQLNALSGKLCLFIACVGGTTKINKCSKGTAATDAANRPGCCDAKDVAIDYNCTGFGQIDDSIQVYTEVRPDANTPACMDYLVEYNF